MGAEPWRHGRLHSCGRDISIGLCLVSHRLAGRPGRDWYHLTQHTHKSDAAPQWRRKAFTIVHFGFRNRLRVRPCALVSGTLLLIACASENP
jgi:hypothetical protein